MNIHLFQAAFGLPICACVLVAPTCQPRTAAVGSIAFSLLALVATLAFVAIA